MTDAACFLALIRIVRRTASFRPFLKQNLNELFQKEEIRDGKKGGSPMISMRLLLCSEQKLKHYC